LIDIPGTASRFIPLKQPGAYPITTGIRQLAQALTEPLEQLDVLEGGYYPQSFADIEIEQQAVRRALIELLSGRRPLSVSPAAPTPPAPFPPPPTPEQGQPPQQG
jgi:hypothetical protein